MRQAAENALGKWCAESHNQRYNNDACETILSRVVVDLFLARKRRFQQQDGMNVLLSVPWDNIGGVCNVVNAVASHLRRQGHGAWLLLEGDTDHPVQITSRIGLPAFRLKLRPPAVAGAPVKSRIGYALRRGSALRALRTVIGDLRIDVVNVHFPHDASVYFADLRESGVAKLATSIHGADLLPYSNTTPPDHNSITSILSSSDVIISPSRSFVAAASKKWDVLRHQRVAIIPNGVDPDELGYVVNSPWSEATPPYVLSVATLVPYKGVDVIIRAFALIAADFPDLRLKLVSGGPSYAELVQLASGLGVGDRVDFTGPVDRAQVARFLADCTLFVLASRSNSESFGIAAAEAMALDRAVIASDIGALPEMVRHGETGLLVGPGDPDALAEAMRRGLSDRPLRERLGRAAGTQVRRDYLWSRTGAAYESALSRVVAGEPILSSDSPLHPVSSAPQT